MCACLLLGGALVLALLTGLVMASEGKLSFWSDRDGNLKIYLMSPVDLMSLRPASSRVNFESMTCAILLGQRMEDKSPSPHGATGTPRST